MQKIAKIANIDSHIFEKNRDVSARIAKIAKIAKIDRNPFFCIPPSPQGLVTEISHRISVTNLGD